MKFLELTTWNATQANEIISLFSETFTNSEGKDEGKLIGDLVEKLLEETSKNDVRLFVAKEDGVCTGALFLSPLRFEESNQTALLLAPVATLTHYQGKGIGKSLIQYAFDVLKKEGMDIVITYGDIRFYKKVGFVPITEKIIPSPLKLSYPQGWLAQSLLQNDISPIHGKSYCVEAFDDPRYW